jgi:hypothetical protein
LPVKYPRRRVTAQRRIGRSAIDSADQVWLINVVSDELFNGKPFRAPTVVNVFSRKSLAAYALISFNVPPTANRAVRLSTLLGGEFDDGDSPNAIKYLLYTYIFCLKSRELNDG